MSEVQRYSIVDIDTWDRKEQFYFFRDYRNPFFGFTAELDVTTLYRFCKDQGHSFFLAYLFASQRVVNAIPELRYRLRDGQVIEYPSITAGATIQKENKVFSFCYFENRDNLRSFEQHGKQAMERCQHVDAPLEDHDDALDQIYYSVIPWIHFKSVVHPRNHQGGDSVPRIVFGKTLTTQEKMVMPISIEAHHALLDGYHLGIYYQRLQNYFDQPESLLER